MAIRVLLGVLAAVAIFFGGYFYSGMKSADAMNKAHDFTVSMVPRAEQQFLSTLDAGQLLPPKLKSGMYVLEVSMPSGKTTRETINIPFVNNNFAFETSSKLKRVGMEESAKIEGNTVSWHLEGAFYDAGVQFVGIVSGNQMFGHVYNYEQTPEGEIGFWRLLPKEKDEAK